MAKSVGVDTFSEIRERSTAKWAIYIYFITNILLGSPIHDNDFQRGPVRSLQCNSLHMAETIGI